MEMGMGMGMGCAAVGPVFSPPPLLCSSGEDKTGAQIVIIKPSFFWTREGRWTDL
jgi:hypothetical protein